MQRSCSATSPSYLEYWQLCYLPVNLRLYGKQHHHVDSNVTSGLVYVSQKLQIIEVSENPVRFYHPARLLSRTDARNDIFVSGRK
ncbi:hypothetical protein PUN28_005070 [Cardiocondyla obscurior]|uniref:Uncharacterized protein n=1 Tax=Cardiocondyla obscurior TaxID=286306 RepID=A0AAW2GJZ0_9HYME